MATDPMDALAAFAESVLRAAATEMEAEVKASLSTPYPGASQPGESPHRRSGTLEAGVSVVVSTSGQTVVLTLTSEAPYSEALELGTRKGVAARPFVAPAVAKWGVEIPTRLQTTP